jgi:hypothetical protein
VVEALVPGALAEGEGWFRAFPFETGSSRDRLEGRIGFRVPPSEDALGWMRQGGALAVKAHFALWARAFAEHGEDPGAPTSLTLSRFCDDLGYARLDNGAHRPASKRQALRALELLASLEIEASYRTPDRRNCRLGGPVWNLDVLPQSFRYRPGPWSEEPVWRAFNGQVALAHAGLLRLRPDREQWAIFTAGYLASLARMNGYRPVTLRARTLLEKTGLAHAERRNPGRMREKLERALDRLEDAGVIRQWDWDSPGAEPDMDRGADLRDLAASAEGWMERVVLISWPAELDGRAPLLEEARRRRRRASRSRGSHAG